MSEHKRFRCIFRDDLLSLIQSVKKYFEFFLEGLNGFLTHWRFTLYFNSVQNQAFSISGTDNCIYSKPSYLSVKDSLKDMVSHTS